MSNFKVFNNQEEISAWEKECDENAKEHYSSYTTVWYRGDTFPIIIDLENFTTEDSTSDRPNAYYQAMSIPDLEEFFKQKGK